MKPAPAQQLTMEKDSSGIAIEISRLCFAYPGKQQPAILDIPDWQVPVGSRLFIHGPSGSGKSTLLNLLGGILRPTAGRINLLGQPFSAMGGRQRDRFRARHIGMVFQQFNLVPYLSIADNLYLAGHFAGTARKTVKERAERLFAGLQMDSSLFSRRAGQLSVGQQQRVAIARALVNQPEILIVDEPTSALDRDASQGFMDLLFAILGDTPATLLFVSHDRSLAGPFSRVLDLRQLNRAEHS